MGSLERKGEYFEKLQKLLAKYDKILLVTADNVGSNHMQRIRKAVRGRAELLMGKNTMIRKAMRAYLETKPQLESIIPHIRENVGMVFTNGDLGEVRTLLEGLRVGAPAKVGSIAPCDVLIPKGDTGLEPTQTAFLQALNIATKINKGQIQIINDKQVITKGEKVGSSEATLLQKLGIFPFSYGLTVTFVYDDGFSYEPAILELSDNKILDEFAAGVKNVACVSLAIGFPTLASVPHSLANAYKNLLSISLATKYTFSRAKELKDLLENPEALAAAQSAAAAAPAAASAAAPAAAAAPEKEKEEEKEESDEDMGFGLFD